MAEEAPEILLHPPQKDSAGRDAVEVPFVIVAQVELSDRLDHRRDLGVLGGLSLLRLGGQRSLRTIALPVAKFLLHGRVEVRIRKIDIRQELAKQSLGTLKLVLQSLNVLGSGVSTAVRRFVVRAFYPIVSQQAGSVGPGLLGARIKGAEGIVLLP